MKVGLRKTTLVDYPGKVAATLFTAGCNLRCPYCHNPELVSGVAPPEFQDAAEVLAFLERRRGVLDGVCVTGGEPTLHPELPQLLKAIRSLGLLVKLDTNGCYPDALPLHDVDFVAMDLKTVPARYAATVAGRRGFDWSGAVRESLHRIACGPVEHEIRITVAPGIVDDEMVPELAALVRANRGLVLQQFSPGVTLDPAFATVRPYPDQTILDMQSYFQALGVPTFVRLGRSISSPSPLAVFNSD